MSTPPQFEFDAKQNEVIKRLADAMHWVAVPLQFAGVLFALNAILMFFTFFSHTHSFQGAITATLAAVFFFALGKWVSDAAGAFEGIVATTGTDVDRLMTGLDSLRKLFTLLSALVKLYLVLLLVSLVVMLVMSLWWLYKG